MREPESEVVHFPGGGSAAKVVAAAEPDGGGKRKGRDRAAKGKAAAVAPVPANVPVAGTEYPPAFVRASQRHDRTVLRPMRLPEVSWRTERLDDGAVRMTYGEPSREQESCEMRLVDRDAEGLLLRHATMAYVACRAKGALVTACLNPTATALGTLVRYANLPEGSLMRLQLLRLDAAEPTWHSLKVAMPAPQQPSLPVQLAIGPYIDALGTDYAFVLVDNAIRIFSLGSSLQVHRTRACT